MRFPCKTALFAAWLLPAALTFTGCRPPVQPEAQRDAVAPDHSPASGEFSVMTYNCHMYYLMDRDGDGQKNNPKPLEERQAVIQIIRDNNPDILAVQEMGDPAVFQEFQSALREAGLVYDHTEYLIRGRSDLSMAVLSRYPIVSRQAHLNDTYTVGEAVVPVARGFIDIDIEISPDYTFRLFTAHLKSKVFHPFGQTEMRRNEARLLGKHIRQALRKNPDMNILVVGDLNDNPGTAALREVLGRQNRLLNDLRPADELGDTWTHYNSADDTYSRIDYILASAAMLPEVNREKTRAVRHPLLMQASDHRPLVAVIRPQNMPSELVTPEDEEEGAHCSSVAVFE